jgi:cellulose biosynthesis protein BcsQ
MTDELYASSIGLPYIDSLKQVLLPLLRGDASPETTHKIAGPETNRFAISVLPGHPQIALLEDRLSTNWTGLMGADLGGARVSNWNTQLLSYLKLKYDLIVYDVGPSLGALNRSILIGVDYFMAPMGCGIFSLIGIENIANWIKDWLLTYDQAYGRVRSQHEVTLRDYTNQVRAPSSVMARFIGYTVQQYITKTIRDVKCATGAYEAILAKIPKEISDSLGSFIALPLTAKDVHLGDVPHMFSLVPLAQTSHTPIHKLNGAEGLSGGQYQQQRQYREFIRKLSESLMHNLRRSAVAPA